MNHCPDCDDNIPEWAERCVNCTEEHELTRRLEAERKNFEHFFMDPLNAVPLANIEFRPLTDRPNAKAFGAVRRVTSIGTPTDSSEWRRPWGFKP